MSVWLQLPRALALAGLAICLLLPVHARAEDKATAAAAATSRTNEIKRPNEREIIVKNGVMPAWVGPNKELHVQVPATLENLVTRLRCEFLEANFFASPKIASRSVSDFTMRYQNVEEALRAICIATDSEVSWRDENNPLKVDPATGLPAGLLTMADGKLPKPMYVLFETPTVASKEKAETKVQVEAFYLGDYFKSLPTIASDDARRTRDNNELHQIEELIKVTCDRAQRIAEELNPHAKNPAFGASTQFHGGTQMLVVIGDADSVAIATKIIKALPGVKKPAGDAPATP